MVTLITGPQGSGKTTYAQTLMPHDGGTSVTFERFMRSIYTPLTKHDEGAPVCYVVDEIPASAYTDDVFCALVAGFAMADNTYSHLVLICQEAPPSIEHDYMRHVHMPTMRPNWQTENSSPTNWRNKYYTLLAVFLFPFLLPAQCVEGSGYLNVGKVDSAECVFYETEAYDLSGLEIEIYYAKTPDSVLVYWPNCDRTSFFRFYQDTTCERSIRESVFMYNESLRQVFEKH